jgi:hypothetical protein
MAFEVYSPNNVPIHVGTLANPDTIGNFGIIELPANFSMFNKRIEFSGADYRFVTRARDSQGTEFVTPEQKAKICAPAGNATIGSHFGLARLDLTVDCNRAEVLIKDITNYSYAGYDGARVDEFITVISPADETGEVPPPKKYDGFNQVIHMLSFSGTGFKAVRSNTRRYDLPDDVSVIIKYVGSRDFDVNCHIDLCPLFTEYSKLLIKAEKNCDTKLNTTIGLINAKIMKAVVAKMQPACGYDLPKLVEEIKELGGFDVDCNCNRSTGFSIKGNTTGGFNVTFNGAGDVSGTASVDGSNISIDIADFSYVFDVEPFGVGQQAFSITPGIAGRTKTFRLVVNRKQLATELLSTIENDQQLLEKLRFLTAGDFTFIVDGKGIIQTNERCDQELTIPNVPAAGTFVMLKTLTIDGIIYTLNQSVNGTPTELAKLNTRLAALNKGNIVASFIEDSVLRIATTQNAHKITKGVVYFPSEVGEGANKNMMYRESNCTNSAPYTPSSIVQAIIDFIMQMTASNIMLGSDYAMCHIEPDGSVKNVQFKRTDSLSMLIEALRDNSCRAVQTNGTSDCDAIRAIFSEKTEKIQATDYLLGTRNGKCGRWDIEDVTREIAKLVFNTNDSTLKNDWCAAVKSCTTDTSTCNPVSFLEAKLAVLSTENFYFTNGPCAEDPDSNLCLALAYVGKFTDDVLDHDVTIRIRDEMIATGIRGTNTRDIVMTAGTNQVLDILNAYPGTPLLLGRKWIIDTVTLTAAGQNKKYLQLRWKNNGSAQYKVAFRTKGNPGEFNYVAVNARPDSSYSTAVFDVPENDYETSVIAICGPGKESAPAMATATSCPPPLAFNVVRSGQNFTITYKFPTSVSKFNLQIKYPNNGEYNEVVAVALNGTLSLPIPGGVYGNYVFQIRSVCNEETGWFSSFSNQVVINVAAPANACPMVNGVEVTDITANTANIRLIIPGDISKVAGYTVILTADNEAPKTFVAVGLNPVVNAIGLTANKRYVVGVITNCAGDSTSDTFNGGNFFTAGAAGNFRAFWGVLDNSGLLSVDTIKASAHFADFADGADVAADWTYNTASKFLWLAIPAAQSNKTKWYGTEQNRGDIGAFPNTFAAPVNVSNGSESFDFYISNFKTIQRNTPIEFREA